jgi:hypothetical protein
MSFRITLFLSGIVLLALVHFLAIEFYLYWTYLWLDMPMHLLGGFCVALGVSILSLFRIHLPPHFQTLRWYVIVVLVVGIAWEIFEYVNGISLVEGEVFVIDTVIDLTLDVLGGVLGYAIFVRTNNL